MKKSFENDNLNDLYLELIENVINSPEFEVSPRGMSIKEITNTTIVLTKPENCLITLKERKLNYAFAAIEKMEYLSGQANPDRLLTYNKNFAFCQNDYNMFDGAYSERLIYWYRYIYNLLKKDPDSRQAVATIYGPQDRHKSKDVPCTLFHHYYIRDNKLNLTVYMRSNDLLWGFPYDVNGFCFLLEAMAGALKLPIGKYTHIVGSLHSYNEREEQLTKLLDNKETLNVKNPNLHLDIINNSLSFEGLYNEINKFWTAEYKLRKKSEKHKSYFELLPSFRKYFDVLEEYLKRKHERQKNT